MVGQVVEVPFIREASLILSGYRGRGGLVPAHPDGQLRQMTVFYRQCELTGTKFTSIWKTQVILLPIILISSIFFMNFIWGLNEVPSAVYPFADDDVETPRRKRLHHVLLHAGRILDLRGGLPVAPTSLSGTVFGGLLFGVMSILGAPVMLTYGVVRGLGQTMPHAVIPAVHRRAARALLFPSASSGSAGGNTSRSSAPDSPAGWA
jgi:hypothetical protein